MSEQRLIIFIPVAIFAVGIATLIFARLLIRNADNKASRLDVHMDNADARFVPVEPHRRIEFAVEDPTGGDET